jgi:hypothetical protein
MVTEKESQKEMEDVNNVFTPDGLAGKLIIYKSGKIKLKIGDFLYDVRIIVEVLLISKGEKRNRRKFFATSSCDFRNYQTMLLFG